MNKTMKKIIVKTIEREFEIASLGFGAELKRNSELEKEYYENCEEKEKLKGKILSQLSTEYKELFEDFIGVSASISMIESQIYFKGGVLRGLAELSYLNEAGEEVKYI